MALLEVFLHPDCLSETSARALACELQSLCRNLTIQIRTLLESKERADALGIIVTPAFVFNGRLIAVGVPRKEWLMRRLSESGLNRERFPEQ